MKFGKKFTKDFHVKKEFSDFAETWHTQSSRYIDVRNFQVLLKQLSYGIKFNFKFEIWENFTKDFYLKKGSLILLKLGTHKVHDI